MRHFIAIILLAISIASCNDDEHTPTPDGDDKPLSITEFTPLTAAYDSIITITGTGFSGTPSENTVTFNGIPITITAATATQLKVKVPKNKDCSGIVRSIRPTSGKLPLCYS